MAKVSNERRSIWILKHMALYVKAGRSQLPCVMEFLQEVTTKVRLHGSLQHTGRERVDKKRLD